MLSVGVPDLLWSLVPLPTSGEINDVLSERDIPIGDSGFARDYSIQLTAGDQIAIELTSNLKHNKFSLICHIDKLFSVKRFTFNKDLSAL